MMNITSSNSKRTKQKMAKTASLKIYYWENIVEEINSLGNILIIKYYLKDLHIERKNDHKRKCIILEGNFNIWYKKRKRKESQLSISVRKSWNLYEQFQYIHKNVNLNEIFIFLLVENWTVLR